MKEISRNAKYYDEVYGGEWFELQELLQQNQHRQEQLMARLEDSENIEDN